MQAHSKKTRKPTLSRLDRLARLPLRLARSKNEIALHSAIVDAAVKLLGAQRVLLVMQPHGRIAASRLPAGENAEELLPAVAPWLTEALGTGTTRLRHGPDGCEPSDQRSCLVAPLLAAQGPLGALYADLDGTRGRFDDLERGLLTTLAAMAAAALAHARAAAALQQQLVQCTHEVIHSAATQKATADVLQIIGNSSDPGPVFDKLLDGCARLLSCASVSLYLVDDAGMVALERLHFTAAARDHFGGVALKSLESGLRSVYPMPLADTALPAVFESGETLDFRDVLNDPGVAASQRRAAQRLGMTYSALTTPLMWQGRGIGTLGVSRDIAAAYSDTQGFSPAEHALVRIFADQAAIAVQNARLFNNAQQALHKLEQRTSELGESLEYQTAISQVLRVISESPTDVAPVFEAIMDSGMRLFQSQLMAIFRYDGRLIHLVAHRNWPAEALAQVQKLYPMPLDDKTLAGRVILGGKAVAVEDTLAEGHSTALLAKTGGWRRMIIAPMLKDGQPVGTVHVAWREPGKSPRRQIELLQTFADQAVIAIENVRLLHETNEALARQTATADILCVISQSPDDIQPVFHAIVGTASRLMNNDGTFLLKREGGGYRAMSIARPGQPLAGPGDELVALDAQANFPSQVLLSATMLHLPDWQAIELPAHERRVQAFEGIRSSVMLPLMRGSECIGVLGVARREPGEFSATHISLLRAFADQAVIAIENVRLFNETQESLQQQKASAEVLAVISNSMADAQPVFEKILDSCKHLFGGDELDVLLVDEQGMLNIAAYRGVAHDIVAATFPAPVERTPAGRALRERRVVHWPDLIDGDDVPGVLRKMARLIGYRSMVFAPMLWNERGIGAIGVARSTGPFKPKELAMLQTFADQAVVAIQNARLFNETKEALEQQTASAEVLKVISSSVADTAPVFETIGRACQRLFSGDHVVISLVGADGQVSHKTMAASPATDAQEVEKTWALLNRGFPRPLEQGYQAYPIRKRRVVHYPDLLNGPGVPDGMRELPRAWGNFSMLIAPMLWETQGIGTVHVVRQPPRPFSDKEHTLLASFADQAVIAIQNARLFNETQEALARQTATANVLKAISRSTFDLAAVLDTLISTAARLCQAWLGVIFRVEGDLCHAAGLYGATPALIEHLRAHPISLLDQNSVTSKAVALKAPCQVEDATDSRVYGRGDVQQVGGYRTLLAVPILRDGLAIGVLTLGRQEARLFNDKEIDLVTSFADQAAIAMDNVRLFNETKEALEQQTASAEVLTVIGNSVSDAAPVIESILNSARRLLNTNYVNLGLIGDDGLVHLDVNETPQFPDDPMYPKVVEWLHDTFPAPRRETMHGYVAHKRAVFHYPDVQHGANVPPLVRELSAWMGDHSQLWVPLSWKGEGIGAFSVVRLPMKPFTDKEIALIKTFADQAVIAIQNAKMFKETQEARAQAEAARLWQKAPTRPRAPSWRR